MLILHKYLVREIIKYLSIILLVVVAIYLSVDFFEKIDDFMKKGLPVSRALIFFLFKVPLIIVQISPVGILLSVIIVLGLMSKNNEIIALKSCGVSLINLIKPVLFLGLIYTIFLFFFAETVVPVSTSKANAIWFGEVRKDESIIRSKEQNIWIRGNQIIAHIKYFNYAKKTIFGITLNFFDKNFGLIRRVDSEKGEYVNNKWLLYNSMDQKLDQNNNTFVTKFHNLLTEPLSFLPEDLKKVVKPSEEMGFFELLNYIKKNESEGYDSTHYRVDLYSKTSFPFSCFIMCLVGAGISLRGRTKEGLAVGISYGLGIIFIFWILLSFCMSLGYGEMLPTFLSAWIADILFFLFGFLNILNLE